MWDYLVKKIRPRTVPRSLDRTAPLKGPADAGAVEPTEQHEPMEPVSSRPRRLLCPACSGAMRIETIGSVEIDRCSACGGIFLDQGELEELTDEELPPVNPSSAPKRGTSTPGVGGTPPARGKGGSVLIYTPKGLRRG